MPDQRCIHCGQKVPVLAFCGNLSLTVFKVVVGVLGNSSALIADGFHSFTDVIGTGMIIISRRVSSKPADERHPYGYGKAEFMSAAFIYIVLLLLSCVLSYGGIIMILHWDLESPSIMTFLGGWVSILYNVIMYRLGQCAGNKNNSPALLANSFENRADAISSLAVVVGIALAMTVHPICDPLAAMAVGAIIFSNCIVELRKALSGLMDRSLPTESVRRIRQLTLAQKGISDVSFIRSRQTGTGYWLDLGIQVPENTPVTKAERIASQVRCELLSRSKHFHNVEVYVTPKTSR